MMTVLAMENKFQSKEASQTLGHARLLPEEPRQLSHPILTAS
jgi:hypothetical protein